jgi:quercetin dioxygenase-like cupin family protein
MPFYEIDQIPKKHPKLTPMTTQQTVPGELMKANISIKPEGKGPLLHEHPNEEQFSLVLEGNLHCILGDEDRIVGPGVLIHIPRNTPHRSRPVGGPAKIFSVKSPVGDGDMNQDYNEAEGAEEAEKRYPKESE